MTSKSVITETLKAKQLALHSVNFYKLLKPQKLLKPSKPGSESLQHNLFEDWSNFDLVNLKIIDQNEKFLSSVFKVITFKV